MGDFGEAGLLCCFILSIVLLLVLVFMLNGIGLWES